MQTPGIAARNTVKKRKSCVFGENKSSANLDFESAKLKTAAKTCSKFISNVSSLSKNTALIPL